jgi:hypothetical protein
VPQPIEPDKKVPSNVDDAWREMVGQPFECDIKLSSASRVPHESVVALAQAPVPLLSSTPTSQFSSSATAAPATTTSSTVAPATLAEWFAELACRQVDRELWRLGAVYETLRYLSAVGREAPRIIGMGARATYPLPREEDGSPRRLYGATASGPEPLLDFSEVADVVHLYSSLDRVTIVRALSREIAARYEACVDADGFGRIEIPPAVRASIAARDAKECADSAHREAKPTTIKPAVTEPIVSEHTESKFSERGAKESATAELATKIAIAAAAIARLPEDRHICAGMRARDPAHLQLWFDRLSEARSCADRWTPLHVCVRLQHLMGWSGSKREAVMRTVEYASRNSTHWPFIDLHRVVDLVALHTLLDENVVRTMLDRTPRREFGRQDAVPLHTPFVPFAWVDDAAVNQSAAAPSRWETERCHKSRPATECPRQTVVTHHRVPSPSPVIRANDDPNRGLAWLAGFAVTIGIFAAIGEPRAS